MYDSIWGVHKHASNWYMTYLFYLWYIYFSKYLKNPTQLDIYLKWLYIVHLISEA
jgi:hypothetical protein